MGETDQAGHGIEIDPSRIDERCDSASEGRRGLLCCPHCGSGDISPEGRRNDEYMDTDLPVVGPACADCGATALTAESWNERAT